MANNHRLCVKLVVWCHMSRGFLQWTATGSVCTDTHQQSLTRLGCNKKIAFFFPICAYESYRDAQTFVAKESRWFLDPAAHVRFCVLKIAVTRFKLILP